MDIVFTKLGKALQFNIIPSVEHGLQAIADRQLHHDAFCHCFLFTFPVDIAASLLLRYSVIAQGSRWT